MILTSTCSTLSERSVAGPHRLVVWIRSGGPQRHPDVAHGVRIRNAGQVEGLPMFLGVGRYKGAERPTSRCEVALVEHPVVNAALQIAHGLRYRPVHHDGRRRDRQHGQTQRRIRNNCGNTVSTLLMVGRMGFVLPLAK